MPTLEVDDARRRFAGARVARLATVSPAGPSVADAVPHLVPVVFALDDVADPDGGDTVLFAVDGKPKRHRRLRRLANIEDNPAVCLLVDHYAEDWSTLWWVRADGRATVDDDPALLARTRGLLARRYEPHRVDPPDGPVVRIRVTRWSGWAASTSGP